MTSLNSIERIFFFAFRVHLPDCAKDTLQLCILTEQPSAGSRMISYPPSLPNVQRIKLKVGGYLLLTRFLGCRASWLPSGPSTPAWRASCQSWITMRTFPSGFCAKKMAPRPSSRRLRRPANHRPRTNFRLQNRTVGSIWIWRQLHQGCFLTLSCEGAKLRLSRFCQLGCKLKLNQRISQRVFSLNYMFFLAVKIIISRV